MTFNGMAYCSLDVSNFTTFSFPGYSYVNQSFDFMGVAFRNVCPGSMADVRAHCQRGR